MDKGISRTTELLVAESNPHLQQRVERYGVRVDVARVVVILLHGRTHSPEYMNEHVVARLRLQDIAYIAPAAADGTWYPNSFLAPISENQPGIDFTIERLGDLADELLGNGVLAKQIVWCGFSQGACAASQFLAENPKRWGGLIAFTGGLIGPVGTQWRIDGDFAEMPTYFSTSEADPFVPEERVRESATAFAAAGAAVSVEFHLGRGHIISDAEIERARFILA